MPDSITEEAHTLWWFHRGKLHETTDYYGHGQWLTAMGVDLQRDMKIWGRVCTNKPIVVLQAMQDVPEYRMEYVRRVLAKRWPDHEVQEFGRVQHVGPYVREASMGVSRRVCPI
jgi:hypothetical protein